MLFILLQLLVLQDEHHNNDIIIDYSLCMYQTNFIYHTTVIRRLFALYIPTKCYLPYYSNQTFKMNIIIIGRWTQNFILLVTIVLIIK